MIDNSDSHTKEDTMFVDEENYFAHYGILRKSGRYAWGSGDNSSQRSKSFLDNVALLRKQGMTDNDIARGFGMTTTELRAANSIARNQRKQAQIAQAQRLKDRNWSNVAIGERMGIPESSVRALLAPGQKDRADILQATAGMLKRQVEEKGYIDVGTGVENHLGVSSTRLKTALAILKDEGYEVHNVQIDQLGTTTKTLTKVLAPAGTTYIDIVTNKDKIKSITEVSDDGGRSYIAIEKPLNISASRVSIRYGADGGKEADGVIYVRPGVDDVSLGGSRYAQVRVAVDGTHYLKGMAVYKDDLPAGVDLVYNSNKKDTGNKFDAMKPMADDPENPFGAMISRQIGRTNKDGSKTLTSAMNIVNEEGSWDKWKKTISTQVLSKQSATLAKKQLGLMYDQKKADLDEIVSLTNPVVKKALLEKYADDADSSAVHLKAAQLPRQRAQVILPVNSMKDTEVYAPNFRDGERVVLIRYPHGGTFEIPELRVNNKNKEAKSLLGQAADAVGINHRVASRLSGADFDGDTVLVIPNNRGDIKTSPALKRLKDFDPQSSYPAYEGMARMSERTKQMQMGLVSNLITDMTIQRAGSDEIARAVRHSMVVIDAEKHNLNYKQSAIDHGIPQLMEKYQGRKQGGAATLISKATSPTNVTRRKPRGFDKGGPIDKDTGERIYENIGKTYTNKKGKLVTESSKSTKLFEAKDAHTLSSGTLIESVYADHSNRLKALANEARKELVNTKTYKYSPSANKVYSKEVETLKAKLNVAVRNRPRERQAQIIANANVSMKRAAYPDLDAAGLKKLKARELNNARARAGANKTLIEITPDEWNAIQERAISNNMLSDILRNADIDVVKQYATPRASLLMTSTKTARAQYLYERGYTQSEIADQLGVSLTTLKNALGGDGNG